MLKHELLGRYLPVFTWKTGSTSPDGKVAYFDAYAGPGLYEDGSPGSPALAVEAATAIANSRAGDRLVGYFIERDPASVAALRAYLEAQRPDWRVFEGDVHARLPDVMTHIDAGRPLFAFLDPFGLGIPFDMLRDQLLSRLGGATEVLLNFSFPGLRRTAGHLTSTGTSSTYLKARAAILDRLDANLGGNWWQAIWSAGAADREAQILNGYLDRLENLPGRWAWFTVPVSDRLKGAADYALILLTRHPDGIWQFHEALSNALEPYRQHCLTVSGELDLEPLADREKTWIAEIAANIEANLASGKPFKVQTRMKEVFGETLGFAREKHVRAALNQLFRLFALK